MSHLPLGLPRTPAPSLPQTDSTCLWTDRYSYFSFCVTYLGVVWIPDPSGRATVWSGVPTRLKVCGQGWLPVMWVVHATSVKRYNSGNWMAIIRKFSVWKPALHIIEFVYTCCIKLYAQLQCCNLHNLSDIDPVHEAARSAARELSYYTCIC